MSTIREKAATQWRDLVTVVLSVWLFLSPWILAYAAEAAAAWNAWVIGVVLAGFGIAALTAFHKWEEWLSAVLAAWLIVSPWILGFAALSTAVWNQVVVGVIVGILALWSALAKYEPGHLATRKT